MKSYVNGPTSWMTADRAVDTAWADLPAQRQNPLRLLERAAPTNGSRNYSMIKGGRTIRVARPHLRKVTPIVRIYVDTGTRFP